MLQIGKYYKCDNEYYKVRSIHHEAPIFYRVDYLRYDNKVYINSSWVLTDSDDLTEVSPKEYYIILSKIITYLKS